jgi:methionyl-tRNA formyltransferase
MSGTFSRVVFSNLVADSRLSVEAIVMRGSEPSGFPRSRLGGGVSIEEAAYDARIPIVSHHSDDELAGYLVNLQPDFLLVACYPVRLSPRVLACARTASLNIHPSMLPRYRGPEPLFWQLRNGETHTGVTIHHLQAGLDAGAIVAQHRVALPNGEDRVGLEAALAVAGVRMFSSVVASGVGPGVPQDDAEATTHCMPVAEDFRLSSSWAVRRAYAFLRGAGDKNSIFRIGDGRESLRVQNADKWRYGAQRTFILPENGKSWVRFADGAVRVTRL